MEHSFPIVQCKVSPWWYRFCHDLTAQLSMNGLENSWLACESYRILGQEPTTHLWVVIGILHSASCNSAFRRHQVTHTGSSFAPLINNPSWERVFNWCISGPSMPISIQVPQFLCLGSPPNGQTAKFTLFNCSYCRVYNVHDTDCNMQATGVQIFALLFIQFYLYTRQNQLYCQSHYTTCLEPDCIATEITVFCHEMYYSSTFYSLIVRW